jgi:SNF2 family DNA or RNA helicase
MVTLDKGKIFVDHTDVLKLGVDSFKKLFKFSRMRGMKWEMTATYPNLDAINRIFQTDLKIQEPESTVDVTKFLMDIDYKFKRKPLKFQLEALASCGGRNFYAYFLEPGLGKTKVGIDDSMILHNKGKVDTVLIICPISAMSVWEGEIAKDTDHGIVSSWPDMPPTGTGNRFYIINHDALVSHVVNNIKIMKAIDKSSDSEEIERLIEKANAIERSTTNGFSVAKSFLMSSSKCMIIIDESTSIADWQSLRTQYCTKLGTLADYRRILTGDPIPNNPIDLYSQLYWLDPTTVKNRSYYAFRGHFCDMGGYKNKQIVNYKNTDELTAICNKHGYRIRTDDVLDMPPQNWRIRKVTPTQKTIDLYNKIVEEDLVSILDDFGDEQLIDVSMVLTQFVKLQQVCGGTLIDGNKVPHVVGNEKLTELMAMLDEWGNRQVLVWHQFREEGRTIVNALQKKKKNVALFNGGLSAKERGEMVRSFENKEINQLIIQNDAGHLSITLNSAGYAVWYSNHLRPIVRNQAERRNWRIGRKDPVMYYDLLMDGFIDNWIYERLKRKRNFNASITDGHMTKKEIMSAIYEK